jgi:hypothetical protein
MTRRDDIRDDRRLSILVVDDHEVVHWGLRLAALEAILAGGIIEFGEPEPGVWRVRLAVPLGRA